MADKLKEKILLCFLYWEGDRYMMEKVVRQACSLMDEPTEEWQLMFVQRKDAKPPSEGVQYIAAQKFEKVHVWVCNRYADGFPGGCNEMAYGILNHIVIDRHLHGKFKDITGIMIAEGDCVFLKKNWPELLMSEWRKAKADGKKICGTVQEPFEIGEWKIKRHVNAVAIYDSSIALDVRELRGGPMQIGWDHYHGDTLVPLAYHTPTIWLNYRCPTITEKELFEKDAVVVYHGVKDESALNLVKKKFGLKKTE